jgi:tripartite ATP-independent transporter DctP family solute receptor
MSDSRSKTITRRNVGKLALGATLGAAMPLRFARGQSARTIRLAHHVTTQSEQHVAAEFIAKKIAEYSGGALAVQILPAAQMGGQREIIESVSLGTLELGYGESGLYANYLPQFGNIALPYIYRDFDHWTKVVDGDTGAGLARDLEAKSGIKIVNWMTAGYRNTFLRTKPITKPADFRGVKIRLPEAPVFVRSFAALGAQPTPIPAPEMYSALQTGVVDAMEGSAEVGYTFKIFEVTKYLSKTRHILLDGSFAINGAFFKGLPQAQQDALMKAAQEAAVAQRAAHFEREKSWLDKLAAANTLQINDADLPAFAAALATLQNEFAANARATELLEKIRKV